MTNNKKIYLTKEGITELNKEYEELVKIKRPAILDRVSQARNMGDLSENAEYTAARDELAFIDGRIDELDELLKQVEIIQEDKNNGLEIVQLGSKITLKHSGKQEMFTLVGEWEADPIQKKISHQSPLGKALLGKKVGETVEVEAPVGKIMYTVVTVQ